MLFSRKYFRKNLTSLLFATLVLTNCDQKKRVIIKSAFYQCGTKQVDVFGIVEKHLLSTSNGEVIVDFSSYRAFNEAFGDPQPGCTKSFHLIYHYINHGKEVSLVLNESDFTCNRVLLLKPLHSY